MDCGCVRGAAAAAAKRGCCCNRVTQCGGLLERIGLDCVWALKLLPCALCVPLLLLMMLLPPAAVLEYRMFAAEYSAARRGARPPHGEYERVFPERDAAGRGGAGVETRCAVAAVDGVRALECACPCVYYCYVGAHRASRRCANDRHVGAGGSAAGSRCCASRGCVSGGPRRCVPPGILCSLVLALAFACRIHSGCGDARFSSHCTSSHHRLWKTRRDWGARVAASPRLAPLALL